MAEPLSDHEVQPARPVLVTTASRGVFFGYTNGEGTQESIKLTRARCCLYWPPEQKGFLGLASDGPVDGARVGPAADIKLYDITSVSEVTPEAVERWEAAPWSK